MSARRLVGALAVGVAVAVLAAGCGSSSSNNSSQTGAAPGATGTTSPIVQYHLNPAAPSASSQMICNAEGQNAIAGSLGLKPLKTPKGVWANDTYTCVYAYKTGTMTLSVHELPSDAAAMTYFNQLGQKLGRLPADTVLGQGTFRIRDDSMFVVKDNKVMDVDVTKLPASFGVPPLDRADVALTIAVTIMGCWTGA